MRGRVADARRLLRVHGSGYATIDAALAEGLEYASPYGQDCPTLAVEVANLGYEVALSRRLVDKPTVAT